jgi:ribosomal RNA-processing protein 8
MYLYNQTPLKNQSQDAAVFCLALMGTNYKEFLREAHRILVQDGLLWIAEVKSRLADTKAFIGELKETGFHVVHKDESNTHFSVFQCKKISHRQVVASSGAASSKMSTPSALQPCLYKRR